jgi:hypothetical protein
MIVAAPKRADNARHCAQCRPIEEEISDRRPQQRADEQNIVALLGSREAAKPTQLSERNPVMRVSLDHLGIRPTLDRKHDGPAAAPRDSVGNRTGKASSAAD